MKKSLIIEELDCIECEGSGKIKVIGATEEENDFIKCAVCNGTGIVEIYTEPWEEKYNNKD